MLNRSHVATIWNFDPNYSLPYVTQVSPPKMFQIVATWLQFSTEEYVTIFATGTFESLLAIIQALEQNIVNHQVESRKPKIK